MDPELDQLFAWHCAPTFAGIKMASLVAAPQVRRTELAGQLGRYNRAFRRQGLRFRLIPTHRSRDLLLVYRPEQLARQLARPEVRRLLAGRGYPADGPPERQVEHLCRQLATREAFPHEVGVFLGYPLEDVLGFVEHGGKGCKCTGPWKVYSDVDRAQDLFRRYGQCREAVCRRVAEGSTLARLFGGLEDRPQPTIPDRRLQT